MWVMIVLMCSWMKNVDRLVDGLVTLQAKFSSRLARLPYGQGKQKREVLDNLESLALIGAND